MGNLLGNINIILAAAGSKPYTIKELTIGDVLKMSNYFIGIKELLKKLNKSGDLIYADFKLNIKDPPHTLLYRASSDKGINPFLFTPGKRALQTKSNIITKLVSDILPSWENIPKRSNSVICTNDYFEAINYRSYGFRRNGVVYVIIPSNDTYVAVAPKADFWYSFSYIEDTTGLTSINLISNSLLTFLGFFYYVVDRDIASDIISEWPNELLRIKGNNQNNDSKYTDAAKNLFLNESNATILHVINAIDQALSNKKFRDSIKPIYDIVIDNGPQSKLGHYIIKKKSVDSNVSIIDILDDLFDPDKNGFDIIPYSHFVNKVYPSCEVWTNKPCIFIEVNDAKFLTELYYRFRR